jgi:hypothetical protein
MPGLAYDAGLFGDMWKATETDFRKEIIDTLKRSHPLLDAISGEGNFKAKKGGVGKRVVETILARANDNAEFADIRGIITPKNVSVLESIEYDWKFLYHAFTMLDKELSINKSSEVYNLLELQKKAVKTGLVWKLARQIYSHGMNPLEMGGLQYLISDNPYRAGLNVLQLMRGGTVGDRYEFWRNRVACWVTGAAAPAWKTPPLLDETATKADFIKFLNVIDHMVDTINRGSEKINKIFTSYKLYRVFINAMRNLLTVNNVPAEKKDLGFATVTYRDIPVVYDMYCPENHMYFINTSQIAFKYLSGENFVTTTKDVPNQLAKMFVITFMGNFIINKPRACGVLFIAPEGSTTGTAATDVVLPDNVNLANPDSIDPDQPAVEVYTGTPGGDVDQEKTGYSGSGIYRGSQQPTTSNIPSSATPSDSGDAVVNKASKKK